MTDFEKYLKTMADVNGLSAALGLLNWDQETMMPTKSIATRASSNAIISGLIHEMIIDSSFGDLLEKLSDSELTNEQAVAVRETKKDRDKAVKVPRELVEELATATTSGNQAWIKARQENNWSVFAPALDKIVSLKKQQAEAVGYKEEPYDALLDEYEPGALTSNLVPLFSELRDHLVTIIDKISDKEVSWNPVLTGDFDPAIQQTLCVDLIECIGFDFTRGRLDCSTHPFTADIGTCNDIRLTVAYHRDNLAPAIYSAIHECGHGLYEQGLPDLMPGTPISESVSLGIHESQSRLWENMVGRSSPFSSYLLKRLEGLFPEQFVGKTADDLYKAVNTVKPSLIRIEADEITYNLHIILRMELERALICGDLGVADLPSQWNESMKKYLNIVPSTDSNGVLQDIHWSAGMFGYFPTYTLGNLYAAQFMETASKELPELNNQIARGEMLPLLHWLRKNIHQHGRLFSAEELCKNTTGKQLSVEPFINYINSKYSELYSL